MILDARVPVYKGGGRKRSIQEEEERLYLSPETITNYTQFLYFVLVMHLLYHSCDDGAGGMRVSMSFAR